jgi:hypothetical protein
VRGVFLARALAFPLLLCAAMPAMVRAEGTPAAAPDSLGGRIVRDVRIEPRDIFDPLPDGRLRGFYRTANRLHVRTRRSTVRSALVVKSGDRWQADRRAESERHLRAFDFLLPDSVAAAPVGGTRESVDVRVVTHDNWTTSPEATFESGGGQRFGSYAFTERNLLGLGITATGVYREDPVGISRYVSLDDAAILGTHWHGQFVAGNAEAGKTNGAMLGLPFWADAAPVSIGAAWSRTLSRVHLFQTGTEVAHFPLREENTELWWGTGRRAADGTVQRFVATFRAFDRRLGESVLEPGAPGAFAGGTEELRLRRLEGEATLWRPRYLVRRGVDFMDRDEDFDVGASLVLGTGVSPRAFGGSADEGWLHGRVGLGADAGSRGFGLARAEVRSRVRSGLRETLGDVRARWVVQPRPSTTFVLALRGVGGRRMSRDFQVQTGALTGLRAFPIHDVAGTRLWRGNAELRWTAKRSWLQLLTLGGAAFWDSGRAWGPGSGGESWHHDAGVGLRLSLPHSALNAVARFDVAWPIAPAVDGRRGPAYSFGSGQAF